MTPTTTPINPGSAQPERPDRSVFDINRFNRTPEAQHYARKASVRTVTSQENSDTRLNELVADAQHYSLPIDQRPPVPEYKKMAPEEMKELLDRVNQTNRLLQWMRREAMGGRD